MTYRNLQLIILMTAAVCMAACSDDFDNNIISGQDDDLIRFNTATWTETDSVVSRADSLVCTRTLVDIIPIATDQGTDSLYLQIFVEDTPAVEEPASRGRQIAKIEDIENFALTGFRYSSSEDWEDGHTPDFMYNSVMKNSWDPWASKEVYHWPGKDHKVRFFAHVPTDAGTLSPATQQGVPTITYTVPKRVEEQVDLMIADSGELPGDYRQGVNMKFRHALASIKFESDNNFISGTFHSFKLDGIYNSGTLDMETGAWTIADEKASETEDRPFGSLGVKVNSLSEGTRTFFAIPQTLPENVTLDIAFTDSLTDFGRDPIGLRTAQIPLTGKWEAGKTYTYRVSSTNVTYTPSITFTDIVTPPPTGGTGSFTVNSVCKYNYRSPSGGRVFGEADCAYTYELQQYNSTTRSYEKITKYPSWLTSFTWNSTYNTFTYTMSKPTEILNDLGAQCENKLKNAASKGSPALPYNLANSTGALFFENGQEYDDMGKSIDENTANCYIINSPGTYSFPLVYGCAYADGEFDQYNLFIDITTCNCNYWQDYDCNLSMIHPAPVVTRVDQNGNSTWTQFMGPYLYTTGPMQNPMQYITKAELLWQDARELVSNVRLNGNHTRVIFDVNQNTITQGNAVITVKSYGDVPLWSWHIWVTDLNPDSDNSRLYTYQDISSVELLDRNLGFVNRAKQYAERRLRVAIYQKATNRVAYQMIGTDAVVDYSQCYNPVWQWGCPTPQMPPGVTCYNSIGLQAYFSKDPYIFQYCTSPIERIAKTIENPGSFVTDPDMHGPFNNLWEFSNFGQNDGMSSQTPQKTIYDPCPVGYAIPYTQSFANLTTSRAAVNQGTQTQSAMLNSVNVKDISQGLSAFEVYSKPGKKGDILEFPVVKTRDSNGNESTDQYYWLNQPYSNSELTKGRCILLRPYDATKKNGVVNPVAGAPKNIGASIRPMKYTRKTQ